jgi:hypothetical protein
LISISNDVRANKKFPGYSETLGIMILATSLLLCAASDVESATAQSFGATGINSVDIYGKQCFKVQGLARPELSVPNIFDHVIIVDNQCFKPVKLRICYHKSERCIDMEVPAQSIKEGWLGSYPLRFFQYDIKQPSRLFN